METKNKKTETQPQDKVWDRVFKIMMQDQPALFIPLINLVFEKQYKRDIQITSINTETYNKDRSRIMSDISFLIENKTYHIECQYSDDKTMAFRMFEYDFHIALIDAKRTNNFAEFNFPRSCVFYIVPKESMPDALEMKINFQDKSYTYKVPVVRLYDYDLDRIEQKELFLFLPYEILRHVRNVSTPKHIAEYTGEINAVYTRIIEIIEKAYNEKRIKNDEVLTLMNMLSDTAEYKLKSYPQIWEGVNDMLNKEYMPKWRIDLQEALEQNTKDITIKVTKDVTTKVTKDVTTKVTKDTEIAMLKLMKENGVPEKQIREIAKKKKISMKVVDGILNSSKEARAVQS